MWRLILLLAILVIRISAIYGQPYPSLRFTTAQGLPSNTIYDVYRDSKGFLWVSTDKGVARYNGSSFEVFTTKQGLSDNEVFFCKEDKLGRIWFATYNGTLCYFENGICYSANNKDFLKVQFKSSFIQQITVQKDSSILFSYSSSPLFMLLKNNKVRPFFLDNKENLALLRQSGFPGLEDKRCPLKEIRSVKRVGENLFRVLTNKLEMQVDSNSHILKISDLPDHQVMVYMFAQDLVCNINNRGVFDFDDNHTIRSYTPYFSDSVIGSNRIVRIYSDKKNYFLAINNKGIFIADSVCIFHTKNPSSITQDRYQNYWIGTLDSGLYLMDKNFDQQHYHKGIYKEPVNYSCARQDHIFFIASDSNLYDFKNMQLKRMFNVPVEPFSCYYIDNQFTFYSIGASNTVIPNILSTPVHRLRYMLLDPPETTKKMLTVGHTLYNQLRVQIRAIDYTKNTAGSALKYNVVNDQTNGRIYSMALSPNNTVWYSSTEYVYEIENGVPKAQEKFASLPLKTFGFYCGYLVGYTHDNKLIICNNSGKGKISLAGENEDCVWNRFYRLDNEHVLISTSNYYRLLTLLPSTDVPSYRISALENPLIPVNTELCSDNNSIFFFYNGSILTLKISSLLSNSPAPNLYFERIGSDNTTLPLNNGDKINLSYYDSRNITIRFSSVQATGSDISYEYSVSTSGFDKWTGINGQQITMANPSYGNYTVRVRAKTLSSNYSEPIFITLIIDKPVWLTWPMVSLYILLSAYLTWLIIKWRSNRVLKKKEEEHQLQVKFMKSEYKTLNALMNPHFIFNTLNNLQTLFNSDDKIKANKYLRIFANLIRQIMHNVSEDLIPIEKELELVQNYLLLEKLRFNNRLDYTIDIHDDVDLSGIMIPPLLLQPLVENSIKHGILPLKTRNGSIHISVTDTGHNLIIEIKDNGVGISHNAKVDKQYKSYGLDNIRKRIDRLNAIQNSSIRCEIREITDADAQPLWTIVTIIIPV